MNPYRYNKPIERNINIFCRMCDHSWRATEIDRSTFYNKVPDILYGLKGYCIRCGLEFDNIGSGSYPTIKMPPTKLKVIRWNYPDISYNRGDW